MGIAKTNKYGLGRHIDASVKRQIRQNSKFSCVKCGFLYCQYHHFDPPFAEATKHCASGITLLCANCHSNYTAGRLSDKSIRDAVDNPCSSDRFPTAELEVSPTAFTVRVGKTSCKGPCKILTIEGKILLSVDNPEAVGGPWRLNAEFYDRSEHLVLKILDNICEYSTQSWDIEVVGQLHTIRLGERNIALKFQCQPPDYFNVLELNCGFGSTNVELVQKGALRITAPGKAAEVISREGDFQNCESLFIVENGQLHVGRLVQNSFIKNMQFSGRS